MSSGAVAVTLHVGRYRSVTRPGIGSPAASCRSPPTDKPPATCGLAAPLTRRRWGRSTRLATWRSDLDKALAWLPELAQQVRTGSLNARWPTIWRRSWPELRRFDRAGALRAVFGEHGPRTMTPSTRRRRSVARTIRSAPSWRLLTVSTGWSCAVPYSLTPSETAVDGGSRRHASGDHLQETQQPNSLALTDCSPDARSNLR